MGGTRAVWEEPGKQKPRSALFASRLRDCGRGNSPEAAPKQMRGGKERNVPSQFIRWTEIVRDGRAAGEAQTFLPQRVVVECGVKIVSEESAYGDL
jgi:hypothetical protein